MESEILAGIRLLVLVAKADGVVKDEEREAIASVLHGATLKGAPNVDDLFFEATNVDDLIREVKSAEVRRRTYEAACSLTQVDRDASPEEMRLLEQMREAWGFEVRRGFFDRLREGWKQDIMPSRVDRIDDVVVRQQQIDAAIRRAAIRTAVFGALPIPGVSDFFVAYAQIAMMRLIAAFHGHSGGPEFWRAFAGNVAGSMVARIAAVNLVKLLPGFGSVAAGTWSFATTYGLGRATVAYFEKGEGTDPKELRDVFKTARKDGEKLAKEAKAEVDAELENTKKKRDRLDTELKAGKITEDQYAQQLSEV